jgi:hypothetical protein
MYSVSGDGSVSQLIAARCCPVLLPGPEPVAGRSMGSCCLAEGWLTVLG